MSPDEPDAIESFERLGLTAYEARVFIGLQRLGTGTAKEVSNEADVPRSQVYSTAESLESKGLLEMQQSSPLRYRPVSVAEARKTLGRRFESERERAFDYVEAVRNEPAGTEEREDVWTVRGSDRIDDRTVDLLSEARDRILFGVRFSEQLTDEVERALTARATDAVDVFVVSEDSAVHERVDALEGITSARPPDGPGKDEQSGRIVIVDDTSILLSVVDDDGNETAIWSADSMFASVFIRLVASSIEAFRGDL